MMNPQAAYSRAQKAADALGQLAGDRHRFLEKRVLLTGEEAILITENGKNCFLDSLRLLGRICQHIVLSIPPSGEPLMEAAIAVADQLAFGTQIDFIHEPGDLPGYDAILSVGAQVHPDLPWTTINSNGWLVRVSSGDSALAAECDRANPIGALAAACLGASEVFKRLIRLRAERGELLNSFSYSLRTYNLSRTDFGPELPDDLPADLLIVGAGAIGNALAHLISRLNFSGEIRIVDLQVYELENMATSILVGLDDLTRPKAFVLAEHLEKAGRNAKGFHMPLAQYVKDFAICPSIAISGLDNVDARHEVQRSLWPDVVIDGAIGDFACQASRHPWADDVACLICLFRKPARKPAEELQQEGTGLSHDRLTKPDSIVTQSDVERAPVEKRSFLQSRVGRTVCSVVQEAMAQNLSTDRQRSGFEPSVPFVAGFSACMVIAETIAHVCGWPSELQPRFQFDFLMGPGYGHCLPQARRADCVCARRGNIDKVRALRMARCREYSLDNR
jgi:molybdopterin/thiamine biosynthesis adenylyltransferase